MTSAGGEEGWKSKSAQQPFDAALSDSVSQVINALHSKAADAAHESAAIYRSASEAGLTLSRWKEDCKASQEACSCLKQTCSKCLQKQLAWGRPKW